jgi:hypothetical protein
MSNRVKQAYQCPAYHIALDETHGLIKSASLKMSARSQDISGPHGEDFAKMGFPCRCSEGSMRGIMPVYTGKI